MFFSPSDFPTGFFLVKIFGGRRNPTLDSSCYVRIHFLKKEKEALVLQIALTHFVADGMDESGIAQALLARVARCLELQGNEQKPHKG